MRANVVADGRLIHDEAYTRLRALGAAVPLRARGLS